MKYMDGNVVGRHRREFETSMSRPPAMRFLVGLVAVICLSAIGFAAPTKSAGRKQPTAASKITAAKGTAKTAEAVPAGEIFGVVEIGASGIKATVFRTEATIENAEVPPITVLKNYEPLNWNAAFANLAGSERVAKGVAQRRQEMQDEFHFPNDHLYLVGSSGLPAEVKTLIAGATFDVGQIDYISPEQEAKLVFRGIVPVRRLQQVLVLDIGSGNSKGAALEGTGATARFNTFAVPLGTKTFAEKISAAKESRTFQEAAESLRIKELLPTVQSELAHVVVRPRIYLAGGTPWAMATLMHPEQIGPDVKGVESAWVKLTVQDIRRYCEQALSNPATLLTPDYKTVRKENRQLAEAEVAKVGKVFNQDQLTAGAMVLKTFLEELHADQKDAVFFSKKALFAWPQGYVLEKLHPVLTAPAPAPSPDAVYGVVEIGASSIKASVFKVEAPDPTSENAPITVLKNYDTLDWNPVFTESGNSEKLARGVAQRREEMQRDFKLASDHFYLVGSSGLPANVKTIVAGATFDAGQIEYITPEQEATLVFRGIVPARRLQQVVLLDIGSGNSKGAYLDGAGAADFAVFAVPLGTKVFAEEINKAKGDRTFTAAAEPVRTELLAPKIHTQIRDLPGLQNRSRIYLAGGTPWALATLTHPEHVGPAADGTETSWVRLSADDVRNYCERAASDPASLLKPDYSATRKENRALAEAEVAKVAKVFNQDQLLAGAMILKTFMEEMRFDSSKVLFFSKRALYAWPQGYVLDKISASKPAK